MRLLTIFITLLALVGCATTDTPSRWKQAQTLNSELSAKFTYVDQSLADQYVFWTGFEPQFHGDGDDYALAAANRMHVLGWEPWLVYGIDRRYHRIPGTKQFAQNVMACYQTSKKNFVCLDNSINKLIRWPEMKNRYRIIKNCKFTTCEF